MKKTKKQLTKNRTTKNLTSFITLSILTIMAIGHLGCGKEDKSSSSGLAVGQGFLAKSTGKEQIEVTLSGAGEGQKFILMPYSLGNYDVVDGAGAEQFLVSAEVKPSSQNSDEKSFHRFSDPSQQPLNWHQRDHLLRTLWNNFVPDEKGNLPEWWWEGVSQLDLNEISPKSMLAGSAAKSWEASFKRFIPATQKLLAANISSKSSLAMADSGCPASIFLPSSGAVDDTSDYEEISLTSSTIKEKVDGGSYCIVYLSDLSATEGETSKDNVKASIESLLSIYKKSIYQDDFGDVSYKGSTYTFKPLFVIADFSNEDIWPKDDSLQFTGAFMRAISINQMRPILYVASDPTKLKTPAPKGKVKGVFHSTIAHEFQHAIMHYFREAKNGQSGEIAALEEGFAHVMEDLMGYGDENFESYAMPYLVSLPDGNEPFLRGAVHNSELLKKQLPRGAAQTFLYYLISQKGGVTYEGGKLKDGDGLAFIREFVKGRGQGVAFLRKVYGGDWLETVFGYLGALVIDGNNAREASRNFTLMSPVADVIDSAGVKGKTVGMHFNRFRGMPDRSGEYLSVNSAEVKNPGIELYHYHTKPLVYNVQASSSTVVFNLPVALNSGVAVIRIQ